MDKYKVSAVSYLNTKPFIYGIQNSTIKSELELSLDIPSVCAKKLSAGEVDLALVPVAVIPSLKEYQVVSDYCIGADGPVRTVCLYSDVPVDKIQKVYLDYQSRTSVELIQILCREYWKITPEFIPANAGFENLILGATAGLVIGDRTFELENKKKYIYDLAEAWIKHTGLHFVFAAWVSRKKLSEDFISEFNLALQKGVENVQAVSKEEKNNYPGVNVQTYLEKNISYKLDARKKQGMELFLKKITYN